MAHVHTDMKFAVSTEVSDDEEKGISEATYRFNPERIAAATITLTDDNGNERQISVHDWHCDINNLHFYE